MPIEIIMCDLLYHGADLLYLWGDQTNMSIDYNLNSDVELRYYYFKLGVF